MTPTVPQNFYKASFALLALVYVTGLFVPLMDSDSAHHANIALHMYLTGDYHSLVDNGANYLDKPHLHFWLCAFSYKIFGVNGFAYKFPSFLFTLLGVYSTYGIGKALYNKETGKLAALIVASAFAFILANNDVRMDAILTASIAFATWQLIEFIQHKKIVNAAGAALGLALGFCTKGHIGVFTPAVAAFFYILYLKDWPLFYNWKWLAMALFFALFISPVVYSYYLQYNLHPEITVRGKNHINGINFILFNQSVERFTGEMGNDSKNDRFFFIHSFLWAFAPWSILAYIAFWRRLTSFFKRKEEWLTTGVFLTILLTISFSSFKLPHYINIVFPTTAVFTAAFILNKATNEKLLNKLVICQQTVTVILLLLAVVVNIWAFPVKNILAILVAILLLTVVIYFLLIKRIHALQKLVALTVSVIVLLFFLLNANFYPQLLQYQAGNEMAFATKEKVNPAKVYLWKDYISASYNFYTATLRQEFNDSTLNNNTDVWLLYDIKSEAAIKQAGYQLKPLYIKPDFEITRLNLKFVNPKTREKELTTMVLAQISKQ